MNELMSLEAVVMKRNVLLDGIITAGVYAECYMECFM